MTTETQMVEVTDDLGAFAENFFNPSADPAPKPEAKEEPAAKEPVAEEPEATDEPSDDDGGDEEETPKPKKRTTADRIKKLALDRARQAEELAQLRAELEALKNPKPLTKEKEPDTLAPKVEKPDPAKYQYGELDPKYIEDVADYRADLKLAEFQARLREQQEAERKQEADRRASATLQETALEIERLGSSKFSDFHELVVEGGQNGEYALTREMFETISELPREVAPDALYYLASYPDEAAKVAKMTERQQALWFGRLEAELKAAAKPAPKKVTTAAPPPASIPKGSGSKSGASLTDINDPRALDAMTKALFG